ncbi:MAG: RHS repeat-associated core domain-containing protein [Methylococcaceae bacterium]
MWSWESEAFGNSLPDQNPSGLGTFVFNLRFPGQYYDAETGLHYNMARYYNPKIGGFDQSDPIGLAGGVNTYAYVGGNPVNSVDPLGLKVVYEGSNKAISKLKKEYEELKKTKKGKEFCEALENSPEKYLITNKADNFLQRGDRASYSDGFKTIVVDPNYHPVVNTEDGPQAAPTVVVLGHEIGHAATGLDDGPSPDRMENVTATENLIRDEFGLPRRTTYP